MTQASIMDKIKKFFTQLFTEVDNQTFDVAKVLGAVAIVVGLSLAGYSVIKGGKDFSVTDFGTGMAALFAGVGVAMGFKKDTPIKED